MLMVDRQPPEISSLSYILLLLLITKSTPTSSVEFSPMWRIHLWGFCQQEVPGGFLS